MLAMVTIHEGQRLTTLFHSISLALFELLHLHNMFNGVFHVLETFVT